MPGKPLSLLKSIFGVRDRTQDVETPAQAQHNMELNRIALNSLLEAFDRCVSDVSARQRSIGRDIIGLDRDLFNLEDLRKRLLEQKSKYELQLPNLPDDVQDVFETLSKILDFVAECIDRRNVDGLHAIDMFMNFGLKVCRKPSEKEKFQFDTWTRYIRLGNSIPLTEEEKRDLVKDRDKYQKSIDELGKKINETNDIQEKRMHRQSRRQEEEELKNIKTELVTTETRLTSYRLEHDKLTRIFRKIEMGEPIPEEDMKELLFIWNRYSAKDRKEIEQMAVRIQTALEIGKENRERNDDVLHNLDKALDIDKSSNAEDEQKEKASKKSETEDEPQSSAEVNPTELN